MVSATNKMGYSDKTDFIVDNKFSFEIGGKEKNQRDKSQKQIADLKNAFVVKDNIETGHSNQIPLWMFGMMYCCLVDKLVGY